MWKYGVAFLFVAAALGAAAAPVEFHVAPNGDDTAVGSTEAPFATFEAARNALRALRQPDGLAEGAVVWIHGGDYERSESFALTDADSGTADAPIVYRSMPDEEVRVVGGRTIPPEAFVKVTDKVVRKRIDKDARAGVRVADLTALGIVELGTFPDAFGEVIPVPELFLNDERQELASWPNDDWASIAKVIESGPAAWRHHESDKLSVFEYSGDRPSRWVNAPDVWLHGYWCFDWRAETIKVKTIDLEKRRITLLKRHGYGIGGGNPAPRRYRAVNLLEELDRPGEYYIARDTGKLYYWPPGDLDGARIVLSTLGGPLLDVTGAAHVTVQGLTFEACVGTGVRVKDGASIQLAGCVVRNTGVDGIDIGGGEKHRVEACDIYNTGKAGLRMRGGDRQTLTPCGHEAVNNHIHHVSRRQRTGAYHVHLQGVGIRVAHNLIHHAPHQSVGIAGNDHVVEYNDIHHISMSSDDCGAYYMGRNPSERGTVIRYNFWHDIGSSYSHGSCAVYFDDGSGGQTVFGNVFYRAAGGSFGAVFCHGGHDNTVDNNIFIECKRAIRQAPWNDERWNQHLVEEDWQNKLLRQVDITKPPYSERYPGLKDFMTPSDKPRVNHAYRNLAVNCDAFVEGNWMLLDNWVPDEDPGFVDAAALNFQLKPGARAFRSVPGFQPIPFDQIGMYVDELRTELP
ncbi:MAG: right-handed parallel beta-helix repeat-containing protein [bacterium]|nr:right-handed parallel beta-helix repeat-containing protein [bacterium]